MDINKRKNNECPKCHSSLKCKIDDKLVCLTSECNYIYREDVDRKFRAEDKTIAELMRDYK